DFHIVPFGERIAHVVQHALDQARAFRAREAELAMDDVGQIGTSQCAAGIRFIIDPRDPEIGHNHLPPCSAVPCRRLRFRNGIPPCRQFDICGITELFQYLSAAAPHVKPPPIASRTTMSPRLIRPSLTAVSNASGTDAAEALACRSTVTTTFSSGRPSSLAVASRMPPWA